MSEARSAPEPESGSAPASRSSSRFLPWVLGAAAVVVGYLFRGQLLSALLGALLAYLLNPLVTWAQGIGIRRSVAVVGLYAGVGVIVVGSAMLLVPRYRAEVMGLASGLPSLTATLESGVDRATVEIGTAYPALKRFLPTQKKEGWIEKLIQERMGGVADLAGHAGAIVLDVILVPLFAFFLLRDGGRIIGFLIDRLHPAHIETSVAVWCEIDRIIGRYLRGLALESLVIGVMATVGLWTIGAPLPLLLGAFTALVNPLPYLGAILSVTTAGIVSLAYGQSLGTVGWILALYVLIRLFDDAVVVGVTIGRSVHLHPMLVLASILAGENA
ncbi:MAG: AI-2E family transporter, partial [candidate division NC10 bacterium]|nr:AI-2E family transporter [candidate division NC10 bacterium]